MKTLLRGFGDGNVSSVNRVKRAAKKRDGATMTVGVRLVAGNGTQDFSGRPSAWCSSRGSWSDSFSASEVRRCGAAGPA